VRTATTRTGTRTTKMAAVASSMAATSRVHRHGALRIEQWAVVAGAPSTSPRDGLDLSESAMLRRRRAHWRTASGRDHDARVGALQRAAVALGPIDALLVAR